MARKGLHLVYGPVSPDPLCVMQPKCLLVLHKRPTQKAAVLEPCQRVPILGSCTAKVVQGASVSVHDHKTLTACFKLYACYIAAVLAAYEYCACERSSHACSSSMGGQDYQTQDATDRHMHVKSSHATAAK